MTPSPEFPLLPELCGVAHRLAERGFTERRVLAYFGFSHPAAAARSAPRPRGEVSPAAALPVLLCTPEPIPAPLAANALGEDLDVLVKAGIVTGDGGVVRSSVALLPIGRGVIACDHSAGTDPHNAVAFPDDSAYHVLGCMPSQARSWLDVGAGNGVLAIARKWSSESVGTDIHARSIELARLGAHITGLTQSRFEVADLFPTSGDRFDLITFNAPLPAGATSPAAPRYRRTTDSDLMTRFWSKVGERVKPGGEVIVHGVIPADLPAALQRGDVVVARYTPNDADVAFGVTRWTPDSADCITRVRVQLTRTSPHVVRTQLTGPHS